MSILITSLELRESPRIWLARWRETQMPGELVFLL